MNEFETVTYEVTSFGKADRELITGPARKSLTARPTTAAGSSPSSPQESPPARPDRERGRLQERHAQRLLELSSARRTLRQYRRGATALLGGILTGLGMLLGATATAVATSVLDIDGTTAVVALILMGAPLAVVCSFGMFVWHDKHRIKTKHVNQGFYGAYLEHVGYLDPHLNVEIAEHEYAIALSQLTEYMAEKGDATG